MPRRNLFYSPTIPPTPYALELKLGDQGLASTIRITPQWFMSAKDVRVKQDMEKEQTENMSESSRIGLHHHNSPHSIPPSTVRKTYRKPDVRVGGLFPSPPPVQVLEQAHPIDVGRYRSVIRTANDEEPSLLSTPQDSNSFLPIEHDDPPGIIDRDEQRTASSEQSSHMFGSAHDFNITGGEFYSVAGSVNIGKSSVTHKSS